MPIKIFKEDDLPCFTDSVKPVVQIPAEVQEKLLTPAIDKIKAQALEEYKYAKIILNESIADVAVSDLAALAFAKKMAQRLLTLIEVAVELHLSEPDKISATDAFLEYIGVPANAIDQRPPQLLNELKQKAMKTKVISESEPAAGGVEKGNRSHQGFVGFSPLAIEHAATGNLREMMYIPFRVAHRFTSKLFANPDHVDRVNALLKEKWGDSCWQLNKDFIDELRVKNEGKQTGIYAFGAYAEARSGVTPEEGLSREDQPIAFRQAYAERNPTVSTQIETARIPLSEREILAQTGDKLKKSDKRVEWLPGEAWMRVLESRAHTTIRAADETGDLMLTGISGSTDFIMTMGFMIGLFDNLGLAKEKTMRDCMVACLGWMVDARDHSAHEILTAAKSFGLAYTPGPDSYKQIRPGDDAFINDLKLAQEKRGYRMPEYYLSAEHVLELAKEPIAAAAVERQKAMRVGLSDLPVDKKPDDAITPGSKTKG